MTNPRARLYVIAAPSGAGKTTLVKRLTERMPQLRFSISYTTRRKRKNEVDGVDYLFVDEAGFMDLERQGELLEWARVFDNLYATSRKQVARQVRESMPECVSIFILPPSLAELERRLRDRRTDSEAVIERRLRDARSDMSHWDEFDYVVINEDLERAVGDLEDIINGDAGRLATDSDAMLGAVSRIFAI